MSRCEYVTEGPNQECSNEAEYLVQGGQFDLALQVCTDHANRIQANSDTADVLLQDPASACLTIVPLRQETLGMFQFEVGQ